MAEYEVVVVGASAGALDALQRWLPLLPATFPSAIVIVVHLLPGHASMLAELLQKNCPLQVKEADDKEPLLAGTVYCAAPNYHLLIESDGHLNYSVDDPVRGSRPSIDVLFSSAADALREKVIGVVLTGANDDGAKGLQKIVREGGRAFVQYPAEAHASAMPLAALGACPEATVVPLAQLAEVLEQVTQPAKNKHQIEKPV
ncbi:chemotaxis protein CheB [Halioxenophilus aromaticivorans]|uniref:protein-glutamate methylesterase n=1 Tax=Halioxenophilus aromaticivorans TaxID=1306992 RepID=A0AAV3U4R4_9ALTE